MLACVEELVIKELNGLCGSCVHAEDCVYRRNSPKVVIQCEEFESVGADGEGTGGTSTVSGLCLNCSKNQFCTLPKEISGVWHCEEYE